MTGFGSYLRARFNIVVPGFWSDLSESKNKVLPCKMITQISWFIAGFIGASLLYFCLAYALGLSLAALDISLYDSEADQQRNFNILVAVWCLVSLVSGLILAAKKAKFS